MNGTKPGMMQIWEEANQPIRTLDDFLDRFPYHDRRNLEQRDDGIYLRFINHRREWEWVCVHTFAKG